MISATERDDSWNFLIQFVQQMKFDKDKNQGLVPVMKTLQNVPVKVSQFLLGGRIMNFPESFTGSHNVPIVPYGRFGYLIVLHHHNRLHRDIDTTVAVTQNDVGLLIRSV